MEQGIVVVIIAAIALSLAKIFRGKIHLPKWARILIVTVVLVLFFGLLIAAVA